MYTYNDIILYYSMSHLRVGRRFYSICDSPGQPRMHAGTTRRPRNPRGRSAAADG